MTTALTLYIDNVASATLGTANQLHTAHTTTNNTSKGTTVGTNTTYVEIASQGNASPSFFGSIQAPTAHGWFYDTSLAGNSIVAGTWTPTIRLKTSTGTVGADVYFRQYKYNGGIYTQIGSNYLNSAVTITTTLTDVLFSGASQSQVNLISGDLLYCDAWLNITGAGASGCIVSITEYSTTSDGAAHAQIVTPGYQTTHVLICDGMGGVFS